MQAATSITLALLMFVLAWPYQSQAATGYEDQTKYLLENDRPMNSQEAEAQRKSFKAGPRRPGGGSTSNDIKKEKLRKLGGSALDICLKEIIKGEIKKRGAQESSLESLFLADIAKDLRDPSKPSAISIDENDPETIKQIAECKRQVREKEKTAAPAKSKKKPCANYPPNTVDTGYGICECKRPYVYNKKGTACVLPETRSADELVSTLEDRIKEIEGQIAQDIDPDKDLRQLYEDPPASRGFTERFFNRAVRTVPHGAIVTLAKRYNTARSSYKEKLEEARVKLKAAAADLVNGQESSAAILVKEAQEIVEGIPLDTLRAQFCASRAKPVVTKQGAYTVIPGLTLPEGCACGALDFSIMKRTLRVYGPVPRESYTELGTIAACRATEGELVNVSESLEDIVINDHYGKRGLMLLYWTSSWLYGDVKVK